MDKNASMDISFQNILKHITHKVAIFVVAWIFAEVLQIKKWFAVLYFLKYTISRRY